MKYVNRITGEVATFQDIQKDYPNISLPNPLNDIVLKNTNYELLVLTEPPAVERFQLFREDPPEQIDGKWVQKWTLYYQDDSVVRTQLLSRVSEWRNQQEQGTVEWNGRNWDADETSLKRMLVTKACGAMLVSFWTDADNNDVKMTFDEFSELVQAIARRGGEIHVRQRQMKEEIANLKGQALRDYVVGWPVPKQ